MHTEPFEMMLTGGHPNSLGRTLEVVDLVLADQSHLEELYQCYFCQDEVVRLRTSSAIKRVTKEHPEWVVPYLDRLLTQISQIDQASTQWTLATLFSLLEAFMSPQQKADAMQIMQRNLTTNKDWIVLNNTMQTLTDWSATDEALKMWLLPELQRLTQDSRKSVARRASKLHAQLQKEQSS